MPRAEGFDLNAKRVSRDFAEFTFRFDRERFRREPLPLRVLSAVISSLKRGTVTEASLLAFLQRGDGDDNLAPGQEPIDLKTFLFNKYLPEKKKPAVSAGTLKTETDSAKRLAKTIGTVCLHEIRPHHAEHHKSVHVALKTANVSIKHDLITLSQAVTYAVACGLIKKGYLLPVRGLPVTDRSPIWLRLADIVKLLRCLPRRVKPLAYFLILTGARINEALAMKVEHIDWENREIRIPNSKRRRRSPNRGKRLRTLKIDDLGLRLEWLLKKIIKPDPLSGHLFPGRFKGQSMSAACAEDLFQKGVMKAGLEHLIPPDVPESGGHDHVVPHDCRRTFANHGAIAGWSFQKLRAYMGQINAQSIQSYLDEADGHKPAESIFCHPPARRRRGCRNIARDADEPRLEPQPLFLQTTLYLN